MPTLPEPPTPSDEGISSDQSLPRRVPATPAPRTNYTDAKTPHPPGAWATPFSGPIARNPVPAQPSVQKLDDNSAVVEQNGVYTPPASLSKASAMTLKTPAPPGAWVATPGTVAAKRMQQKVRFNDDQTLQTPRVLQEESSLTSNEASYLDGSVINKGTKLRPVKTEEAQFLGKHSDSSQVSYVNGDAIKSEDGDIFVKNSAARKKVASPGARRSKIRMLDAMGNEIVEERAEENVKQGTQTKMEDIDATSLLHDIEVQNLERKEALELLHQTITALKNDFYRTDDPLYVTIMLS